VSLTESIVEDAALTWFGELGYAIGHGPQMAPGEPAAERHSFGEVVLVASLRQGLRRVNGALPNEAIRRLNPANSKRLTLAKHGDTLPPRLLAGELNVANSHQEVSE
jgi:hypothetical protein